MSLKKTFLIVLATLIFISVNMGYGQTPTRVVTNFDSDWKFSLGDIPNAKESKFNDNAWRILDLPHDWSVEGTISETEPAAGNGGYFPTGTGWYRKHNFHMKKNRS
jgi:beta-galactosidase